MTPTDPYSRPLAADLEESVEEYAAYESPRRPAVRLVRLALLLILLFLLVWAGLKAWRVAGAVRSLLAVQQEGRALLTGGITGVNPDAAEALVVRARDDIVVLREELGFIRPVAPYMGWVPTLGPTLVAAPHLLDMADAGSETGVLAVRGLKPALAIAQQPDFGMARMGELLPVLTSARPQLEAAALAMERYVTSRSALDEALARASLDSEALPWRVRQLLQVSDKFLPAARGGLYLLPQLPSLLGADGPRRYLIMAQNEDELRPTGGFLTGAGALTVEAGRIVELSFRDANRVDNWKNKPYDFPPQPFYDLMGLELFLFRDANYWPNFPTSAQKAMDLYAYGLDAPPFDGAVAIDQEFLRLLVDATGPIPVPGSNLSISADNLLQTLREARDIQEGQAVQEWVRDRKAFLGGFAAAILGKVESDFGSVNPVRLARNMAAAIEARHLTLYMRDRDTAAALTAAGWDGRLPQAPPGDLVMAVDTNMGYNKVNLYVERTLNYTVTLGDQPESALTVHYRHTGPARSEACYQGVAEEFTQATDYLTLADKCYWNYLRAYAPAGTQLTDSSRLVVPGDTLFSGRTWDSTAQPVGEQPFLATFANFMLLPQGAEMEATFRYQLPAEVVTVNERGDYRYQLAIRKQPGTRPESLSVTVTLPDGVSLVSALPLTAQIEGNRIAYDLQLDRDLVLTVEYR